MIAPRRSKLIANLVGRGALCATRGLAKAVACVVFFGAFVDVPPALAEDALAAESDIETKPLNCREGIAEQVAGRIQARYDDIRDFEANFVQVATSATFAGQPLMSAEPRSGRVILAKPGKMRWTYLSPDRSVVVSNGKWLWIYDVEGQSITRFEVTKGFLSGAALQFLLGDGKILESFEVVAIECLADRVTLGLHPKTEATYQQLGLVADPRTGDLIATSILDLFGNRTRIRFSDTRLNRDPDAETFEMEIPEGVELIDYAAQARFGAWRESSSSPAD